MKPLVLIFSTLLVVSVAFSQRGGGAGHSGGTHSGGGHSSGGSSIGGRTNGGFSNGGRSNGGFGNRPGGGGSVGGHGGYSGGRYGGRTIVVPYAVPVYGYGGGYYPTPSYGSGYTDPGAGYSYATPAPAADYQQQDQQPMDYGPQGGQSEPPPAPEDNSLRIYQAPAPSPQEAAMAEGRYYLIAYKDHSVYTALAFWMENGALHYVTPQNAHNQVSLDLLDMDLTRQLNSRRGLAFNIVNQ